MSLHPTILVVDNDKIVCDYVAEILEERGYKVIGAKSGEDALVLLDCLEFDVVLLDLLMPDMDGNSFLDSVKSREGGFSTPVVVLSAAVDRLRQDLKSGVCGSVDKPIYKQDLLEKVEQALQANNYLK